MGKDPKKARRETRKIPHKKHRYARRFEHLSHSHSSWDLQTYGGLTQKITPRADEHGTRSFWRWIPIFFFRVKCDASHLVFFFSGCEGLPRDGKAKGQTRRTRRRGSGPRRGSARRGMFSIGFSFRVVVTREAWMGDGAHFCAHFFSSFSLLFWVDVEAVKNEMTDIVTLSLSQSSAAACAPTNTRSSVNTTS